MFWCAPIAGTIQPRLRLHVGIAQSWFTIRLMVDRSRTWFDSDLERVEKVAEIGGRLLKR